MDRTTKAQSSSIVKVKIFMFNRVKTGAEKNTI